MKSVSTDYIAKEQASQRKPVELYHIWGEAGQNWYYTSGDVEVDFNGNTYEPGAIKRGSTSYNAKLEAQTCQVSFSYLDSAITDFIEINPVDILWISIMKLHREQSPLEADVIFVGQVKNVSFKGVKGVAQCVGFEHFLKRTIPTWRYILTCNHLVFDENCALTKSSYTINTTVTVGATEVILTSSDFGLKDDGYYTRGEVVFGDEARAISNHVGNDITIVYRFKNSPDSSTVAVSPGCDGRITTCRDKFDNIIQYLGFPFIPVENPALRMP